jgi:hypothetical protein
MPFFSVFCIARASCKEMPVPYAPLSLLQQLQELKLMTDKLELLQVRFFRNHVQCILCYTTLHYTLVSD